MPKFLLTFFVIIFLLAFFGLSHNMIYASNKGRGRKTPSPIPTTTLTPTPTVAPTATPTPTPTPISTGSSSQAWSIQSVSSMKETKDKICGQDSLSFINQWVATAKQLGVNYIAVETPYDSPSCADSTSYTRAWVSAIRAAGLKVWHRHMPLSFEGIYSIPKIKSDYLSLISSYIKNNPDLFKPDDIFTPIPEPQPIVTGKQGKLS